MNVLLAVTGGIAAYKSIALTSLLIKNGHQVQVILTEHAQEMVKPLPFEAISKNKVITGMFDASSNDPLSHINLATWADVLIIAPASANCIAKLAHGIADDFLTSLFLAWEGKTFVAPAMNTKMYFHPSVQKNMVLLTEQGIRLIEPESGYLACGTIGVGKMMEPEAIYNRIFPSCLNKPLENKHVLISAGPTREALDPVRFISNHSSGKMGYALAAAAIEAGAKVTLVSGPVKLEAPVGVSLVKVISTQEMFDEITARYNEADVVIMAAAPSDYHPINYQEHKIKKGAKTITIELEENPDILFWLGQHKSHQILVGFAAESQNLIEHATKKLKHKNLDFIVGNNIISPNAGFEHDFNTVTIISRDGSLSEVPTTSKTNLAIQIIDKIGQLEDT